MVQYESWQRVKSKFTTKDVMKKSVSTEKVAKKVKLAELLLTVELELDGYSVHLFRVAWQQHQLKTAKNHTRPKSVVLIMDYAENYTTSYQDKVQSARWVQNQIITHPIMGFVNSNDQAGLSTHNAAVIFISDDMKHDADGVNTFVKMAYKYSIDKCNIKHFEQFSDCSATQYRCSKSFVDLSLLPSYFDVSVRHHYFEASHNKFSPDGL